MTLEAHLASLPGELSVPRLRRRLREGARAFPEAYHPLVVEMADPPGRVTLHLPAASSLQPVEWAHLLEMLRAEVLNHLTLRGPARLTLRGSREILPLARAALEALRATRGVDVLFGLVARLRGVGEVSLSAALLGEGDAPAADAPRIRGDADLPPEAASAPAPPAAPSPRPWPTFGAPRGDWIIGVDVGGTDVKILALAGGRVAAQIVHPWARPPHTWSSGEHWLPALQTLVRFALLVAVSPAPKGEDAPTSGPRDLLRGGVTAADLATLGARVDEAEEGGIRLPIPRAVGLSFPDVVVGEEIVGGITGKTRGMEAHLGAGSPAYWANFEAFIRPLAFELGQSLGGVPVFPLADGAVGAVLAAAAQGAGPCLALSLGTSVAVGVIDEAGALPPYPLYGSHLILSLSRAPWSAHDTTGTLGVAQKGPTQKGMMAMAGPEGPFPRDWSAADAQGPHREGGARDKARVSYLLGEGSAEDPLLHAMGESLADLVAELCHVLGWGPAQGDVWIYGRMLEGPGGEALLDLARAQLKGAFPGLAGVGLRPAAGLDLGAFASLGLSPEAINTLGQALGAALFALRRASGHVHPMVARSLARAIDEGGAALSAQPYRGYDVIILSASTEGERRSQEAQFDALFKGIVTARRRPVMILSVLERWPSGAGNLLGTLHAYQEAVALARSRYGVDLDALFEEGEVKIALLHNGGAGKRCSPLVQAENNSRGAIRLPGVLPTGEPLTLLTAVGLQIQALAAANGGRELDVFWSSQLFFGTRDLRRAASGPHLLTKLAVGLAPGARLGREALRDLGIFAVDAQGSALEFFTQGTFEDDDALAKARPHSPEMALDMGSFRIKARLLRALMRLYAPQLEAREGKRDLDPDLTQPLVALIGGLSRAGVGDLRGAQGPESLLDPLSPEDRRRVLSFPTHGEVLALLLENPTLAPNLMAWVGTFDLGSRVHWWRMRRPGELYNLSLGLLGDIAETLPDPRDPTGAPRAPGPIQALEAVHRRRLFAVAHPITQCQLGEVFIEGPEVSFAQMAEGVHIGGVHLQGSILRHCTLLTGSSVRGSVLSEVAGWAAVEASALTLVAAPQIRASRAYVYRRVGREPLEIEGRIEAGSFRPSAPRGLQVVMAAGFDVDGKAVDGATLPGNPMSFRTLRDELLPAHGQRLFRVAESRGRAAAGLPPLDKASAPWRCRAILQDATGIAPGDPESALRLLETSPPGSLDPVAVRGLAKGMAEAFMALAGPGGGDTLPRHTGSPDPMLSPEERQARQTLDVLARIAARPEKAVAEAASGPLFGGIIEGLNDTLRPESRALSARALYRVFSEVRGQAGFEAFDGALRAVGIPDEGALASYHRQIRTRVLNPTRPEAVGHIAVLPRVTVGAEVAIGTALVRRLLLAFPEARISYLGDPKLAALLEGEPRIRVVPFAFPRRGGLRARLEAWVELRVALGALAPDLVVGPDSRADQVGILPVTEDPGRYLYWENTLPEGEGPRPMAELLDHHLTRQGLRGEGACIPTLWPRSDVVAFGRGIWRRLALEGSRGISVKYDVGGLEAKRLGDAFEQAHLMGLLASKDYDLVVFDRGFGDGELARSGALLAKAQSRGFEVLSVTDLGRDGVGFSPSTLPAPGPSPRPRILAFHGTIGGWASLSLSCQQAFSYDSVHQHLAAADRVISPGAEAEAGSHTVVAFAGYPTPWFPQLWAPMGRGRIEVIRGEGVDWRVTLARVLAAHRRLL